jgi:sulfide:quinone oxidoreductase
MPHTLIVGSGFAGCTAARTLRKKGYTDPITVISPSPELFYYPSLIWVPTEQRDEADLRINLKPFFDAHKVTYHQGKVVSMDAEARTLTTENGATGYDYLIIASGGRYIRKLPGIEHAHIACAGWEPTKAWSDNLHALEGGTLAFGFAGNPKEPSAMRGGPVFEFMFGTDTWLRKRGRRDQFELVFFSPAPRPGARMGEKAVDRLLGEMKGRDIKTHLGSKMKAFEANKVITEGGEFHCDLTLFVPGMTGPQWAAESGLPLTEGGFFQADQHCRVPGFDGVYVAGDAGSFPGPDWKPKQAHMADLQAEAAVNNLIARMQGKPETQGFKTELICIVDSLDTGSLVFRRANRTFMLKTVALHWAKVMFEWNYLRAYRNIGRNIA